MLIIRYVILSLPDIKRNINRANAESPKMYVHSRMGKSRQVAFIKPRNENPARRVHNMGMYRELKVGR